MIELGRVESVLSALVVGISYDWCDRVILAHAFSGQKNKLGYALDHLLSNPNGTNARLVTMLFAKKLVKDKVCTKQDAWDLANDAISWWWDQRCTVCDGRGVLNFEQDMCVKCQGTGIRPKPRDRNVRQAIGVLDAAIEMMECQLRKKLKVWY